MKREVESWILEQHVKPLYMAQNDQTVILSQHLGEFDKAAHIVVHCRSGGRSAKAVNAMRAAGFTNAWNVNGGILAWADQVDPSVPKY